MKILKFIFLLCLAMETDQTVKQIKLSNILGKNSIQDPLLRQELSGHKSKRKLLTTDADEEIHEDQDHSDVSKAMIYASIGKLPLTFEMDLPEIEKDLNEHRMRTISIISDSIKAASISVYINNAVLVEKLNHDGYSQRVLLPFSKETESLRIVSPERKLVQAVTKENEKLDKQKELLKVAENGKLFDINMDDVYNLNSIELEKFKKDIEDNDEHI
jgi:hypothetical protein